MQMLGLRDPWEALVCTGVGRRADHAREVRAPVRRLHVRGHLDAAGVARLHEQCLDALEDGAAILELDFTGMTGCPSALFLVLSRVANACRRHARPLRLIGLADAVRTIVVPARAGGQQ